VKKFDVVWPQYLKNSKGTVTHVYLPIEAYEAIDKELKEYEKIQKAEGVAWVKVPAAQKPVKKRSTKR
jgi:hypothetical protein